MIRLVVLITLAISLVSFSGVCLAEEGVTLVIDFDALPAMVTALALSSPPQAHARPMLVGEGGIEEVVPDSESTAKILLGLPEKGDSWNAYVLPSRPTSFLDKFTPETGEIEGGPSPGRDIRVVHLPKMQYLAMFDVRGAEKDTEEDGPYKQFQLGLVAIGTDVVSLPEALQAPGKLGLEISGKAAKVKSTTPADLLGPYPLPSPIRISGDRPPESAFDIVVIGDGFTQHELPGLVARARSFAARLLGKKGYDGIAPFNDKGISELISIYLLPFQSPQSGITFCPCSAYTKSTCFGVRGHFTRRGPGDFDTDKFHLIEAAAGLVTSPPDPSKPDSSKPDSSKIEAILVIANCPEYGGRGFRDRRTAFVPMVPSSKEFTNLAVHELAHAVADIGDEYEICSVEKDAGRSFCNVASWKDRQSNAVWWLSLAIDNDDDLVGDEVELFCDPDDDYKVKRRLRITEFCGGDEQPEGLLGLFARTMFVSDLPGYPCVCNPKIDARSCNYYRPEKECKMRRISKGFCRVCEHVLRETIREAAGESDGLEEPCFVPESDDSTLNKRCREDSGPSAS